MIDNEKNEGFSENINENEEKRDVGEFAAHEPVNGEYHFTDPASTRSPYSDAGYVASDEASAVPPRYYCGGGDKKPPKAPKEKKPRKSGMSAAGIIAVCLVCAILGGLGGGAIASSLVKTQPTETQGSETVLKVAAPAPTTSVSSQLVSSSGQMSPQDIYTEACQQVVAITTEITYYNIFGYSSSSAVSGSGFIISDNGYILTNYHVIEDAVKGGYDVEVYLHDGTEYIATIVGYEEDNDIAVLKIDAEGLNPVTIGDSDSMQVGESVYAVGNPLGELQYTMTAGMVSALDREISSSDSSTGKVNTINMFQMDAAVNSGNSGGPVYNSRGEVIGVVTAKYSTSGVEGLGFGIPINDAISIANELMTKGYVSGKAYMGITCETVSSAIAQYYNMVEGAYVYSMESGSCAEKCGLQLGDIIVALDGKEIKSFNDLSNAKKDYRAGDTATLKVYRAGEYLELSITFDEEVPRTASDSVFQGRGGSR